MKIIIDRTGDTYGERELLLYWIYWLQELFSDIESNTKYQLHDSYIKLEEYYILNYFKINENPDKRWLLKLRLGVPKEFYNINFQEHLQIIAANEFYNKSITYEIKDIVELYISFEKAVIDVPDWQVHIDNISKLTYELIPKPIDQVITRLIGKIENRGSKLSVKLTKQIADALLSNLKNVNYALTEDDQRIIAHPIFKQYRSKFIREYGERGFSNALDHLLKKNILQLPKFYNMCHAPSEHFHQWLVESFKYHCNDKRGKQFARCNPRNVGVISHRVGPNKTEKVLSFVEKA